MGSQPHFILTPLMCPGHLIPSVDLARLLAQNGVVVTFVTTPINAARITPSVDRDIQSGLPIRLLQLRFPCKEVGLPEGYENIDTLPRDQESCVKFFTASSLLQKPLEHYMEETRPNPSCIVSDKHLAWTTRICRKFRIPRLAFDGMSCFAHACSHFILASRVHEKVSHDQEEFVVPGFPDRIELTKAQLPADLNPSSVHLKDMHEEMAEADRVSFGWVVNSFEELESAYVKVKGEKVWCIGPVSLCNKENLHKACRGNKAAIDKRQCLKWLDSKAPSSVVYVCLGTLDRLSPEQLMELGLGLEASNRPFMWVIREGKEARELKKMMLKEAFEERIKERGLVIWGWAPQLMMLSHPAIGDFLTHCGWNSVLEGVSAGVPMITWPLFSEQFYNEKFVVQVLRIGKSLGAKFAMPWGEEEKCGVMVKREEITRAVGMGMGMVMAEGQEREERRARARKLGELAKRAMEEGGSSHRNMKQLIEDVLQQVMAMKATA